jgi:hypothetical protein
VESTNSRVVGLTFGEACALREAARRGTTRGDDVQDQASTTDMGTEAAETTWDAPTRWYGARLALAELSIHAGAMALGAAELALALAVWVIRTVAPLSRQLGEWLCTVIAGTDAVMGDDAPMPTPAAAAGPDPEPPDPARAPDSPQDQRRPPLVVDGEVLHVMTVDQEGAA